MLEVVNKYKYIGVYFDKHLNFTGTANVLAESSGRALGGIIGKFKTLKNVTYYIF